MASMPIWRTVAWELHSEHPPNSRKKTLLYQRLFGRRVRKGGKEYRYDGLLEGFKGQHRVRFVDYERHSRGVIAVPREVADKIGKILAELKIDHRIIQYRKPENYLRRTYEEAESTPDAVTTCTMPG